MADTTPMLEREGERADLSYAAAFTTGRKDRQRPLLLVVAALAVTAIVFSVAAIAVAKTASSTSQKTETNLQSQSAGFQSFASRTMKSEVSSMMLLNHPVCVRSRVGQAACFDLTHTAQLVLADFENTTVEQAVIQEKIENGDYNVGNSVVFTTVSGNTIDVMHPALLSALGDKSVHLTASAVADASKCDLVWEGVACLAMIEIGRSDACANPDSTDCNIQVVPVIHILAPNVDDNGRARREGKWLVSVAGIPDRRPLSAAPNRRRGGCGSGLGEPLICECQRGSSCGYLNYYRDPSCRWGC